MNTAGALGEIFGLVRDANATLAGGAVSSAAAAAVLERLGELAHILGLDAGAVTTAEVPADVLEMAAQRQERRAARDFAEADRLRDAILARGYDVRDSAEGYQVVPAE